MDIDWTSDPWLQLSLHARVGARGLPHLVELDFRFDCAAPSRCKNSVHPFELLLGQRMRRIDLKNAGEFLLRSLIIFFIQRAASGFKMRKGSVETRLFILQSIVDVIGIFI